MFYLIIIFKSPKTIPYAQEDIANMLKSIDTYFSENVMCLNLHCKNKSTIVPNDGNITEIGIPSFNTSVSNDTKF